MDIMITDNGDGGDVVVREPIQIRDAVDVAGTLAQKFRGRYAGGINTELLKGEIFLRKEFFIAGNEVWVLSDGIEVFAYPTSLGAIPPLNLVDMMENIESSTVTYNGEILPYWKMSDQARPVYARIDKSISVGFGGFTGEYAFNWTIKGGVGIDIVYNPAQYRVPCSYGWLNLDGSPSSVSLIFTPAASTVVATTSGVFPVPVTTNADLYPDTGIGTAVYMSLFDDPGWMEGFKPADERVASSGQLEQAFNDPITAGSIAKIQRIATSQLQWLLDDGVCSALTVSVRNPELGYIEIDIRTTEPNNAQNRYKLLWNKEEQKLASYLRTPERSSVILEAE